MKPYSIANFNLFDTLSTMMFEWLAASAAVFAVFLVLYFTVNLFYLDFRFDRRALPIRANLGKYIVEGLLMMVACIGAAVLFGWMYSNHGQALDTVKILIGVPLAAMVLAYQLLSDPINDRETVHEQLLSLSFVWPMIKLLLWPEFKILTVIVLAGAAISFYDAFSRLLKAQGAADEDDAITTKVEDIDFASVDDETMGKVICETAKVLNASTKHDRHKWSTRYFVRIFRVEKRLVHNLGFLGGNVYSNIVVMDDGFASTTVDGSFYFHGWRCGLNAADRDCYPLRLQFEEDGHFLITFADKTGKQLQARSVYWPSYVSKRKVRKINKILDASRKKGQVISNAKH